MSKINGKIKTGDIIYKHFFNLVKYEVFGILEQEGGIYYRVKCLTCINECQCQLYVKYDEGGNLIYVSMLGNSGPDKYCYHATGDYDYFQLTAKDAYKYTIDKRNESDQKLIENYKEKIKQKQKIILERQEFLEAIDY